MKDFLQKQSQLYIWLNLDETTLSFFCLYCKIIYTSSYKCWNKEQLIKTNHVSKHDDSALHQKAKTEYLKKKNQSQFGKSPYPEVIPEPIGNLFKNVTWSIKQNFPIMKILTINDYFEESKLKISKSHRSLTAIYEIL